MWFDSVKSFCPMGLTASGRFQGPRMLFLEKRALHGTWTRDSTGVSVPGFDKMPLAVSGQGRALVAVFCSGTCRVPVLGISRVRRIWPVSPRTSGNAVLGII